jgi:uncharacterized protein (DUF3820 family)
MKVLYEDDKFPMGKYEGRVVKDVVTEDPRYVKDFNSNVNLGRRFSISDVVIAQAHESIRSKTVPKPRRTSAR